MLSIIQLEVFWPLIDLPRQKTRYSSLQVRVNRESKGEVVLRTQSAFGC